jgi:alpha-tubulin suppressor-like RCC1 family protein
LGDGTTTSHDNPESINLGPGISPTAIAADNIHSLAIGSDGNLYSWGDNTFGEVGDGTRINRDAPTVISLATGITPTAIAAGSGYSLAIGSDGNLYAWGDDAGGALGDGTTTNRQLPEAIILAPDVTPSAISAGVGDSLAIGSDGNLYAWGANSYGQLGDGSTANHYTPEAVTLAPGVTPVAIAAGNTYALAIGSDGNLYAWGDGGGGELGNGTQNNQVTPEVITLAPGVRPTAIAANSGHSLAIGSNGTLYSWGFNDFGDLGDGTATSHYTPEAITLAPGISPTAIAEGDHDGLAIGSDGQLYAWGDTSLGECCLIVSTPNPKVISLAPGVGPTAISASDYDVLAIGSTSSGPPPDLPDSTMLLAFPVLGGSVFGLVLWWTRRRRASVSPAGSG